MENSNSRVFSFMKDESVVRSRATVREILYPAVSDSQFELIDIVIEIAFIAGRQAEFKAALEPEKVA